MSALFRVLEVYRPHQRGGPILVGETRSAPITVGTRLVSPQDPTHLLDVLAVEFPTDGSVSEGRLAVVVSPDLGELLRPGAIFDIVNPGS